LLTGGGEEADNADMVIRGFGHLVDYLKARRAGHLYIPGCTEPAAMGGEVKERVVAFAKKLASNGF